MTERGCDHFAAVTSTCLCLAIMHHCQHADMLPSAARPSGCSGTEREREREGDADMFLVKLFACVRVGNRESGTEA